MANKTVALPGTSASCCALVLQHITPSACAAPPVNSPQLQDGRTIGRRSKSHASVDSFIAGVLASSDSFIGFRSPASVHVDHDLCGIVVDGVGAGDVRRAAAAAADRLAAPRAGIARPRIAAVVGSVPERRRWAASPAVLGVVLLEGRFRVRHRGEIAPAAVRGAVGLGHRGAELPEINALRNTPLSSIFPMLVPSLSW